MTGGMADLLAAHQPDDFHLCTCGFALTWGEPGTFPDFDRQHVEHVEAVLIAAGYGDVRALLADLRLFVLAAESIAIHDGGYAAGVIAESARVLLARHTAIHQEDT